MQAFRRQKLLVSRSICSVSSYNPDLTMVVQGLRNSAILKIADFAFDRHSSEPIVCNMTRFRSTRPDQGEKHHKSTLWTISGLRPHSHEIVHAFLQKKGDLVRFHFTIAHRIYNTGSYGSCAISAQYFAEPNQDPHH